MEKYLKDNILFLAELHTSRLDENIIYQLNTLDAQNYNTTQEEIYYQLNRLYEKVRTLEDINGYLQTSIANQIATSSALCESLLKEIEESRDAIKETTYHNIYVDLEPTQSSFDRDGTTIPSAVMYDGKVVTKYHIKNNIPYTMEVKTFKKPYQANVGSLEKNEAYRSYYVTDQSYKDGITEELSFLFKKETPINRIAAKSSSTKPFDYQIHNLKGSIVIYDLNWKNAINAEKCTMMINTKTFKEKSYLCDTERLAPNALTIINEQIYKELIGKESMSQSELDTLLGLTKLKADYQAYLEKCELWQKRRKEVAATNKENGYKDSVPEHELVILPNELGANDKKVDSIINQTINTKSLLLICTVTEKATSSSVHTVVDSNESIKPSDILTTNNGMMTDTPENSHIIPMYENVEKIYPEFERYRFDFLDPNNDRYYLNLLNEKSLPSLPSFISREEEINWRP